MIWRIRNLLYLLLIFFIAPILYADDSKISSKHNEPTLWLTKPRSRATERQADAKRLPEAMCPTRRTNNDVRTQLQSGAVVDVQWRQSIAAGNGEGAKIELLAADSNSILARLSAVGGDAATAAENGEMSKLVRIPEGFDCAKCILRLTVDVDSQSQMVSCADVQITPRNQSSTAAECFADSDCGGGECFRNLCYCPTGQYGPHCANSSTHTSQLAADVESSRYNAFTFPTQGQFLWRIDREQNAIEMALRVPRRGDSGAEWYALGVRPEDEASKAKCMRLMTAGGPVKHVAQQGVRNSENSVQVDQPSVGIVPVAPSVKKPSDTKNNLKIQKIGAGPGSCGENEQWNQCPEFSRECEPSCDWTAFPESIPSCPKACGQPRCVCREGFVRAANDNNECRPFEYCQASEVVAEECPRNETFAKCGTACEPSCETMYNVDPCTATCQTPACTCADNYVRFNGGCIFWANCPHLEERFLSSTGSGVPPLIDSGLGSAGAESTLRPVPKAPKRTSAMPATAKPADSSSSFVTDDSNPGEADGAATVDGTLACAANETVNECGRVCEVDCVTIFERDDCSECDTRPACACKQGFARHSDGHCVYWNDCPIQKPDSSLTSSVRTSELTATTTTTTTRAEPTTTKSAVKSVKTTTPAAKTDKTAATKTVTKSSTTTTTTTTTATTSFSLESAPVVLHDCFGEWAWPIGCAKNCDYKVSWIYAPDTDLIDFALESKLPANWWSGIGFAAEGAEDGVGADWIVVKSRNGGELSLHDMHADHDGRLVEDPTQNAFPTDAKLGTHVNGMLRAAFSRQRANVTAFDGGDASFAEGHCHRLLFPVSGGRVQVEDGAISSPLSPPHRTPQAICIRACPQQKPKPSTAATLDADTSTISSATTAEETATATGNTGSSVAGGSTSSNSASTSAPAVGYTCQTEFRYPAGCAADACEYRARWALDPLHGDVGFEVSARGIGRWTGIGFSADGQMADSDVYTGWVYDHRAYVTDRYAGGRQMPAIDARPADIYNISGALHDDVQTIAFRRKVVTGDNATDLPLDRCWHFLFPVGGGRVMARQGDDFRSTETPIGFHDQAPPEFSARRVCLCVDGVPLDANIPAGSEVMRDDGTPLVSAQALTAAKTAAVPQRRRARRQIAASATAADDAFVCSDLALVEVRDGGAKIHVSDAFALSKRAVQPDAFSFSDVSAQIDGDMLTVLLRKPINESETNDFSLADGPSTIYLASGRGAIDFAAANLSIELTRVNLLHPEKYSPTTVPHTSTNIDTDASTQPADTTSAAPNTVFDDFSSLNSDGPFDVSSAKPSATEEIEDTTPTVPGALWSTTRDDGGVGNTDRASSTATGAAVSTAQPIQENITERPSSIVGTEAAIIEPTDENCAGAFRYPDSCTMEACQYAVQWTVNSAKRSVDFRLVAETAAERWTGIGFSSDGAMANADVIVVSVLADASVTVMDQFSFGYGRPRVDKMQDVFNAESVYRDGRVHANFSRNLQTGDEEDDVDLLSQCYRFIFLHTGGALEGGSGEIRKHTETPVVSRTKICLGKCGLVEALTTTTMSPMSESSSVEPASSITTESITKAPKRVEVPEKKTTDSSSVEVARVGGGSSDEEDDSTGSGTATVAIAPSRPALSNRLYDVVVRLTREKWSADLEDATSERFAKMSARIINALRPAVLARWPSLKEIRALKFAEGSVMALLQIEFNAGGDAPSEQELREFLHTLVADGDASSSAAAALHIDANTMEVRENTEMDLEDKWGPLNEMGAWVIVGIVLVLCAIVCVLCFACICRRRRSSRDKHNKSMHSFSPHYAYQYNASAYPTGITNAAYMGGISGSKDADGAKTGGGGSGGSSTASTTTMRGGKKSTADKSPRTPKTTARYDVSEPGSLVNLNNGSARQRDYPRGMGETTYQEWFAKVASKDAPSHYQESTYATPPICRQLGAGALAYSPAAIHHQPAPPPQAHPQPQSYVTYPNDPGSYYTLNGEHKLPPPSYYHRH